MTHGRPWVQGCSWEVSKEPNHTRHVGYQFSQFSTLKMNTGSTLANKPLKFQTRLPWGDPWTSLGPGVPFWIFFGRFLASISAQVWRNITKITKNADFKKTGPPAAHPFTDPNLGPLGIKKIWEVSGIYDSSCLKKYYQKHKECRF